MPTPLSGLCPRGRCLTLATGLSAMALAVAPAAASAAPAGGFSDDYNKGDISQFTFGSDMTLTPNGETASGTFESWYESVTPNAKYLYVASAGNGTVAQYGVSSSGTLTPLSPAAVSSDSGLGTAASPIQVAVSPDGHNAYVANSGGSVAVFDIGSGGTLTQTGSITSGISAPTSVAVSPDGASVYVADSGNGDIREYNRASDGALTPKATPTVPSALSSFNDLALTPDGKFLYESDYQNGSIHEYSVGSGGELAPLPVPSVSDGTAAYTVIVSPNGKNAYSSSCDADAMYQYSIASDGELTPLSPPAVSTPSCGLPWMLPAGSSLYVPNDNQTISQFDVSSAGALTPKSPATATDSSAVGLWGFVIPPDQGPVASFSAKVKGKKVQFDASKSSDSDGTVVSYHWTFGDGQSLTSNTAKVSHTYKKAAKHKVTLLVTDDSGCSNTLVFTGQTAYCNGTRAARTSHTVKVAAKPLKLKVTPARAKAGQRTCYAFRATSGGHGVKQVTVRLAGHTTRTGSTGAATLCLTLAKGSYTSRASKSGYQTGSARVRVSAARPVFTG